MGNSQDSLSCFKKTISRLVTFSLYIGMGWVLVMMVLTTLDVAGRYFFSIPIPGAIETSEFMLAIFGILGMAYTHHSGGNVKVTMLTKVLPPRLADLFETITLVLSLQMIALIAWYGWVSGVEEFHVGTTTDTLGIPIYPLYFLLCFGAGLLCLELLISLIEAFGRFLRPQGVESDPLLKE